MYNMNKPKNYPFIEFPMAKLAKEKGFNIPCNRWSEDEGNRFLRSTWESEYYEYCDFNSMDGKVSIPTYELLIDWFREVHNVCVSVDAWNGLFWGKVHIINDTSIDWSGNEYTNYYNSLLETLKKAFELI